MKYSDNIWCKPGSTIDHRFPKLHCILGKCKKIVGEDNDLVPTLLFMKADKELTSPELVWVHHIKCLEHHMDMREKK